MCQILIIRLLNTWILLIKNTKETEILNKACQTVIIQWLIDTIESNPYKGGPNATQY